MTQEINTMSAKCVNHAYLDKVRREKNLTCQDFEDAGICPKDTAKNILTGVTKNPRSDTLIAICEFLRISVEQAYVGEKQVIEEKAIKEDNVSVLALKEIYEFQMANIKETNEAHINNIRSHYESHIADLKENFGHRSEDKREIIRMQDEHIKTLKNACVVLGIACSVCFIILVGLLIAEVMNPNLGWIKF
jgi:predicted transcriptional regulator